MIVREFKKLYGKLASIRDYELKNAIKEGGMVFVYRNQRMTMTSEELAKRKMQIHGKKIVSKFYPTQSFTLYDFVFKPDSVKKLEEKQSKLL